jgi:DUF177 domain-containing protein
MTTFPLRALRLRSGEEHRGSVTIELEPFVLGGERYVPVPSHVPAELTVQRATGGDVFRLSLTVRLHGPCMRCLDDAVCELTIEAREYHDADPAAGDDLRSEYVVDDQLDLSAWSRDELADALPDQIVCAEDCPGLCGVCGEKLDRGPHRHDDEPDDPRWGALETLRRRLGD